jgi:hypothetical protein
MHKELLCREPLAGEPITTGGSFFPELKVEKQELKRSEASPVSIAANAMTCYSVGGIAKLGRVASNKQGAVGIVGPNVVLCCTTGSVPAQAGSI